MAPMNLPPGFRFHPTDEELVAYYLDRKITGRAIELEIIPEVDLYKCEPWDLPDKSFLPSKDMEWYFYSPRDRKYPNGSRTNRATRAGYWKATGKDRAVHSHRRPVGMKKTLVYYKGRAPHGIRTNWVMHEYRLLESATATASETSPLKDSYGLCRVVKKSIHVARIKEEQHEAVGKDSHWFLEDHASGDDLSATETSQGRGTRDENITKNHDDNRFASEASSSDITQGTPTENATIQDDLIEQLISDEANSSNYFCSSSVECLSNLIEDVRIPIIPNYMDMHYEAPFPPLALEDFPQIDLADSKPSKPETVEEYTDYTNASILLEEIYSLFSADHYNSTNT